MSKKNNKKKISVRPMYLVIDNGMQKTHDVSFDEDKIEKCDIVLVKSGDYKTEGGCTEDEFVNKMEKWLQSTYPEYDWVYKQSRKGNHVFWKEEKILSEQIEFPFTWDRDRARKTNTNKAA